jgi:hypothetical protein
MSKHNVYEHCWGLLSEINDFIDLPLLQYGEMETP